MPRILSSPRIAEFRERLCDAATRLFAERGLDGLTMRAVADALGISPMTPYRYFRDKDDILAAVRARAFDRFSAMLEQAFARPGSVIERSRAVADAYLKFAFDEQASYRLMFDLSQPGEENYPDLIRASERARRTMTDHVQALVDAGMLEGDPVVIGHALWAGLHGAVVLELAGKLGPSCNFSRIYVEMTRAIFVGFSPRP